VLHCERVIEQLGALGNDPGAAAGAWFWRLRVFLAGRSGRRKSGTARKASIRMAVRGAFLVGGLCSVPVKWSHESKYFQPPPSCG
jgi:hypothetical protein